MSSTFEYTLEEQAALLGQFADAMEIARERKRPVKTISHALQAIISDDDIVAVQKFVLTPTGKLFHVTGNCQSAKEAVDATDCPLKWGLAEKPAEIPMIIQPVDCRARAIPLGQVRTTERIYKLYPKILTPAEFFAFGAKFPEEQRKAPHLTVWLDANGLFCCALLDVNGAQRRVRVNRDSPGDEWYEHCRVLVRE